MRFAAFLREANGDAPQQHCVHLHNVPHVLSVAEKRCTSSREGKVLLSCWITPELRMELDRVWAAKGYRPHGRTQKGMNEMIAAYLAAQAEG